MLKQQVTVLLSKQNTKHWQTKFVSPHQRITCWAFKEEKGVGERRINCSIIPKYNETQQNSYIHWVRLYFLINWPSCFQSELANLAKESFNCSKLLMEASYLIFPNAKFLPMPIYDKYTAQTSRIRMYSRLQVGM